MKKFFLSFLCVAFLASLSFGQNDTTNDDWTNVSTDIVESNRKVRASQTGIASSFILDRTDGAATSLIAGGAGSTFRFDNAFSFKIQAQPKANIVDGLPGSITKVLEVSGSAPAESFNIDANGNIGIGVPFGTASERITINGTVLAEEAKVILDVTAPDYVFEKEYNLRSLEEVESYIKENKHLPEIPSAAEFAEDGVKLGQMSFDLLKKVEELTLYMIELKKENEELKSRVEELEKDK